MIYGKYTMYNYYYILTKTILLDFLLYISHVLLVNYFSYMDKLISIHKIISESLMVESI